MVLNDRCPYFIYDLAVAFLSLTWHVRFNVGLALNLVEPSEVIEHSTEYCDVKIFKGAFRQGLVPELTREIYKARGGIHCEPC